MRAYKATLTSIVALALFATATATAQDFDLFWHTVDGGGEMWTVGGDFELSGTIGQPDAGATMTGGDFALTGGFWVVPVEAGCAGDLDGDGDTDQADLGILLADWGCTGGCVGDLDGDGDTDQGDLGVLLADWGCGTP